MHELCANGTVGDSVTYMAKNFEKTLIFPYIA